MSIKTLNNNSTRQVCDLEQMSDFYLKDRFNVITDYWVVQHSDFFLEDSHIQKIWVNELVNNIHGHMPDCRVQTEKGRIWLSGNVEPQKLKNIFGISSYSYCKYCLFDELDGYLLEYCEKQNFEDFLSFALRIECVGSYRFSSQDKAKELDDLIIKHHPHLRVDRDNPEKEIFIEIRDSDCYIFTEKTSGMGGIPPGVEGRLVALMSDRIDSPIASYMMMKHGFSIIPVYVEDPFMDEKGKDRSFKAVETLKKYQPDMELKVIPDDYFCNVKKVFKQHNSNEYILFYKHRLYQIAEDLANEYGAVGIVVGESLGCATSHTDDNLHILDEFISLPIYRPLIGLGRYKKNH